MNDINKLTGHQVFKQIQTVTSDHPIGKGTILFANSFTGMPVDMNQEVRDVLTSESFFVGNNPIVQLQKALERLEDGPWYIDCRDNVLYIHNKPYSIQPVYNYVYSQENGEVLSVSFKTSYRTKSANRGVTMSFDAFRKTIQSTSTGIQVGSEQDIHEKAVAMSGSTLSNAQSGYLSPDIRPEANYWKTIYRSPGNTKTPQQIQAESDDNLKRDSKQDYEYMKQYAPEVFTNQVQNFLRSKNLGQGSDGEKVLRNQLKEAGNDPSKVSEIFQEWFSEDVITIDNGVYRTMVETKNLSDLIPDNTYIPAYNNEHQRISTQFKYKNGKANVISGTDFGYSVEQFLDNYNKDNVQYVVINKPTYTVKKYLGGSTQYQDVKVQIAHKQRSRYQLSGVQFMMDHYSRSQSDPAKAYTRYLMNNSMNNNTRKITERKLEVEMRVVGRPQLTSVAKIHIENIGSRTGDYHIKTCIHRLSSDGYTCSLTLSPGDYKVAANTDSMEVGIGSSKQVKRSPNGGEEKPTTNGKVYLDLSLLTRDEMEYFASQAGNINKQTAIAIESTYNLYLKASERPGYRKNGVYHKHVEMEGDQVKRVWYTKTLPAHGDDYNDFKTAYSKDFYELIRRKTETYKRYKGE